MERPHRVYTPSLTRKHILIGLFVIPRLFFLLHYLGLSLFFTRAAESKPSIEKGTFSACLDTEMRQTLCSLLIRD